MLEYEFEKVCSDGFFAYGLKGHQEIIRRRAAAGWRYVGYIPTEQTSHGAITELELVFEREQGGKT